MPFHTLKLKPGVNLEASPELNTFQLAASNLIRFYGGLVQKLGGWTAKTTQLFIGTCRGLHGWADIVGNAYLAIGTDQRLQILFHGTIQDITPIEQTDNVSPSFSTIINTPNVTIDDGSYSPDASDWINLQTQVSVGGIVLFGFYQIQSIVDSSHYVINAGSNATATVSAGGAVPSYTTTNTQPQVNVALNNHGLATGGLFPAEVSTTVATIVIFGTYSVTFVDANNFTITGANPANAGTTASENSGNARIQYLIPSGTAIGMAQTGFGVGAFGSGPFGGTASGGAQIIAPGRQWSLDHWGQDLIASPSGGAIYYWQPPTIAPAIVVSMTAPLYNLSVFVMPQAQIIVSLGAEISGTLQPLLVRWCDVSDFTDWTASATNQAGSYQIPTGSTLVGGLAVGLGAFIWTDNDLWSLTYLGFPLVFGFNNVGPGCGLMAQRAAGVAGSMVMWLGSQHQFFQASTSGGVQPMECPVFDFYWDNVDLGNLPLIFCAVNTIYNEMAWHFPVSQSSPLYSPATATAYVKYNYVEQCWDYGISSQYQRTAWAGHSPVGNPIGADISGLLQEHETALDANGAAMLWSWQTGFFEIEDAQGFIYSDFLIPDFVTVGAPTFTPNIQTSDYSNGPVTNVVANMVTTGSTYFITFGARGRYWSIGFDGPPSDVGTFSRLGAIRIRSARDGSA